MIVNWPNSLTLLRVALIPILVLVFFSDLELRFELASLIFIVAALTDWLDGYLARRLDQTTSFGAFLDPVADKLMVTVAIILLIHQQQSSLFTVAGCIIVAREILVSALREWMSEIGQRTSVRVSWLGKLKTTVQMTAMIIPLALDPIEGSVMLYLLGYALFMLAALLTIWSMCLYLLAARRAMANR